MARAPPAKAANVGPGALGGPASELPRWPRASQRFRQDLRELAWPGPTAVQVLPDALLTVLPDALPKALQAVLLVTGGACVISVPWACWRPGARGFGIRRAWLATAVWVAAIRRCDLVVEGWRRVGHGAHRGA